MTGVIFDPLGADFTANPYPFYARLRQDSQPCFSEDVGAWLLSRYGDVDAAARNPKLVRSLEVFMEPERVAVERRRANWHDMPNHARFVQFSLLDSDGAVHQRLRMLVLGQMSRRLMARYRGRIQAYVSGVLDQLLQARHIDFVADLAAKIPGHIIGNVLGVPDEHCGQLRIWSENVVQFFDVGRSPVHKALAEQATTEFYEYLLDLIELKQRRPQDDLLSKLIAAKAGGALDETELISTCMLILMAGHGSTIDVLGTGMNALLNYPEQLRLLQQAPEHMPSAVQEMFRYESPLPYFHRYASESVVLHGRRYPKGTKFGLLYGSANRDADAFTKPDQFDFTRQPNRHIAFGRGAHLCLGNHLSRLDMDIVFTSLLARVSSFRPMFDLPSNQPVKYRPGLASRGLLSLPLELVPR